MTFFHSKRTPPKLLLLAVFLIFQSCVAYHSTPTTLNTAVNMGPVKIIDNRGAQYKFKSIELKEGVYYGTGAVYGNTEYQSTPDGMITVLDTTKYEAVYLKDKKKSKKQSVWLGIGLAIPVAYLVIGFIALLAFGF